MSVQSHQSDPRVLDRRTLRHDHRALPPLLRRGMSVLDVGCGSGAITAGIAEAVGPEGRVVGVDRDESLLAIAAARCAGLPNLTFERQDALSLSVAGAFEIVTAARALQWMSDPAAVLRRMKSAARPGGQIVVLDYNHDRNTWAPDPPPEFALFYQAFLAWRSANGWDNAIADHLPDLFVTAGIADPRTVPTDEVAERGAPDFNETSALWAHVIATIGPRIVAAGHLSEAERIAAVEAYDAYIATRLERQTLSMGTVIGG